MKATTFFKILNRKIKQYDKTVGNPFEIPQSIVLIWIEDFDDKNTQENSNKN